MSLEAKRLSNLEENAKMISEMGIAEVRQILNEFSASWKFNRAL